MLQLAKSKRRMERSNEKSSLKGPVCVKPSPESPHDGRRASRSSKMAKNSLDRHIHGGHVESFQHDLLEGVFLVSPSSSKGLPRVTQDIRRA